MGKYVVFSWFITLISSCIWALVKMNKEVHTNEMNLMESEYLAQVDIAEMTTGEIELQLGKMSHESGIESDIKDAYQSLQAKRDMIETQLAYMEQYFNELEKLPRVSDPNFLKITPHVGSTSATLIDLTEKLAVTSLTKKKNDSSPQITIH